MKFFHFVENYRRYGSTVNSHDLIKTAAVIIMVIDHVGYFFFPYDLWWRAVGRIGFPVWFFMAGYAKPGKDDAELKIFAVIMVLADIATVQTLFPLNALVSILACRALVRAVHEKKLSANVFPFVLIAIMIWYPITMMLFEYGSLGLIFAYAGYLCRQQPGSWQARGCVWACAVLFIGIQIPTFGLTIPQSVFMGIFTLATCYWLTIFRTEPVSGIPAGPLSAFMRFTGRNTLYIYLLHYLAFQFAQYLMKAPPDFHLRFIK